MKKENKHKTFRLLACTLSLSLLAIVGVTMFASSDTVDGATSKGGDIIGVVTLPRSSSTAESSSKTESSSGFDGDVLIWAKAGDIDGSNEKNLEDAVNEKDVILLLNHIHFPDVYPIDKNVDCDINKDGKVDDNDAAYLKMYIENRDDFPIQETTEYGEDE